MNEQYSLGDVVLGNWILSELIGEGSYGRVFKAEREEYGRLYQSAIKIITIPKSQSELRSAMADGMNEDSVATYFHTFVDELVDEISLMSKLKGNSNIVSYEDHTVVKRTDRVGWDIIIRMELLTPLPDYIRSVNLTKTDIIKMGISMCNALELCQKNKIVHRDIKPENIFVNDNGDFKLGDFGIARTIEKTTSGLSKKGTYTYMAPEIYRGEAYGLSVDIYSLGLVLYRLLNDNRSPFIPDYPAQFTYHDQELARAKRLNGEKIPPPAHSYGKLSEIVLKACSFDPKDRYSSPILMRDELDMCLYDKTEINIVYPISDDMPSEQYDNEQQSMAALEETVYEHPEIEISNSFDKNDEKKLLDKIPELPESPQTPNTSSAPIMTILTETNQPMKKKQPVVLICIAVALAIIVSSLAFFYFFHDNRSSTNGDGSHPDLEMTVAPNQIRDGTSGSSTLTSTEIAALSRSVLIVYVYDTNRAQISSGSGFIAFDDITLVTNYHVIEGGAYIEAVSEDDVIFTVAGILYANESQDIAVLQLERPTGLPVLEIDDSMSVQVGDTVYAIGSPFELKNTVSNGIISAIRNPSMFRDLSEGYDFQTTASISPGSSGGVLLSEYGKVIGITTAQVIGGQNLNFAIPSSELLKLDFYDSVMLMADFAKQTLSVDLPVQFIDFRDWTWGDEDIQVKELLQEYLNGVGDPTAGELELVDIEVGYNPDGRLYFLAFIRNGHNKIVNIRQVSLTVYTGTLGSGDRQVVASGFFRSDYGSILPSQSIIWRFTFSSDHILINNADFSSPFSWSAEFRFD
jgi:SLAP domain-containing protein